MPKVLGWSVLGWLLLMLFLHGALWAVSGSLNLGFALVSGLLSLLPAIMFGCHQSLPLRPSRKTQF